VGKYKEVLKGLSSLNGIIILFLQKAQWERSVDNAATFWA
jgi:hypothetical protein